MVEAGKAAATFQQGLQSSQKEADEQWAVLQAALKVRQLPLGQPAAAGSMPCPHAVVCKMLVMQRICSSGADGGAVAR